jgi:adenine-specific DNA-methyltransferase
MPKSLIEELPAICAAGKRRAAQMLESLEGRSRVTLQTRELVFPAKDTNTADLFRTSPSNGSSDEPNRLVYGDNLLTMTALLAGDEQHESLRGKVDLIYIDPPFDSKADYRTKITLPGTTINQQPTVLEQFAYSDTWADGTASYVAMIVPRLVLIRELLADTGSLFLHIDYRVGHYVKIVLDEIFGRDQFVNEIIWQGAIGDSSAKNKKFIKSHDTLLFYRKNAQNVVWTDVFQAYDPTNEKRLKSDEVGQYRLGPIDNPGGGGYVYNLGLGEKAPAGGYRMPIETARQWLEDGLLVVKPDRVPQKKIYLNPEGVRCRDVWDDVSTLQKGESTGYSTQKPMKLLERIVTATTKPGDLVADFFVGSGTTAAVADKLERRWVVSDLGKPAAMITRKRLIDENSRPFVYQAIGDYQVEQARSTLGRRFRVGELAQVVLNLYGALPLPPEDNVNGSLGRLPSTRTLVHVDSPAKLTTISTLRRAQGYRDTKLGGFDKVIVLGWNFSAGIGQDIAGLNDPNLEVLVIPPDLLDRLKKKGTDRVGSDVRFSSLQYLQVAHPQRKANRDHEELRVRLSNYVLLSPDALSLDEKNRERLHNIVNEEPLALIEYWAVDPDYDGEVFRSIWQDYRGNTDNDDDPLRVVTEALLSLPRKDGPRTICVRAVDVFGFESEVVVEDVEVSS